ncbi:MarR family transcriptional regulator [Thermoleophilia bacterium SCSIO 60948]|nr:MarR family transcriptional regulator [Thermoleophilia bacterium SCSIO 60948]
MSSDLSKKKRAAISSAIDAFRAATSQDGAFDALAAETLGISATDLRCLDLVQAAGGMTAGELATASELTTGAVTAVADRLEAAGYVRRVRSDTDRRKVRIEVTDHHFERADEVWAPLFADWQRRLGREFTVAELETVARFLALTTVLGAEHAARLRGRDDA